MYIFPLNLNFIHFYIHFIFFINLCKGYMHSIVSEQGLFFMGDKYFALQISKIIIKEININYLNIILKFNKIISLK